MKKKSFEMAAFVWFDYMLYGQKQPCYNSHSIDLVLIIIL